MGTSFRPYSPDQELLLPPSLNEWLAEGHLAYFISDVVEELDLSAFYACYEGDGRRKSPFDPRMMLKVLRDRNFLVPQDCPQTRRGRGLSRAGCRQFPQTSNLVRFPQTAPECLQRSVCSGDPNCPGGGAD